MRNAVPFVDLLPQDLQASVESGKWRCAGKAANAADENDNLGEIKIRDKIIFRFLEKSKIKNRKVFSLIFWKTKNVDNECFFFFRKS